MNDHFEELIHDGIDQLTAGSALPADLADRARRQVRRRRHQVRAALVAGTAAAAVIAVIAATSAGPAGTASKTSMGPHPSASATLLAKSSEPSRARPTAHRCWRSRQHSLRGQCPCQPTRLAQSSSPKAG